MAQGRQLPEEYWKQFQNKNPKSRNHLRQSPNEQNCDDYPIGDCHDISGIRDGQGLTSEQINENERKLLRAKHAIMTLQNRQSKSSRPSNHANPRKTDYPLYYVQRNSDTNDYNSHELRDYPDGQSNTTERRHPAHIKQVPASDPVYQNFINNINSSNKVAKECLYRRGNGKQQCILEKLESHNGNYKQLPSNTNRYPKNLNYAELENSFRSKYKILERESRASRNKNLEKIFENSETLSTFSGSFEPIELQECNKLDSITEENQLTNLHLENENIQDLGSDYTNGKDSSYPCNSKEHYLKSINYDQLCKNRNQNDNYKQNPDYIDKNDEKLTSTNTMVVPDLKYPSNISHDIINNGKTKYLSPKFKDKTTSARSYRSKISNGTINSKKLDDLMSLQSAKCNVMSVIDEGLQKDSATKNQIVITRSTESNRIITKISDLKNENSQELLSFGFEIMKSDLMKTMFRDVFDHHIENIKHEVQSLQRLQVLPEKMMKRIE